jgi:hypothetical protein
MSENKQDKKESQVTNPIIPQASIGISASAKEKMKNKKPGAVESEGINDVNDVTMDITW